MATNRPNAPQSDSRRVADQASLWLARRDGGLSPAKQDEFMQWLAADPRHREVLLHHAAAFERMMKLYEWQPGQSADANPDLFAPRHARHWRWWGLAVAAAAAITLGGLRWWNDAPTHAPAAVQRTFLRVNETLALPDGSVVELKDGSRIAVAFSSRERQVRLTGEAHFNVAKNSVPFVVQVGNVAVQAVGTTFNVRAEAELLEVLVTEGSVAVQQNTDHGPRTTDRGPQTMDRAGGAAETDAARAIREGSRDQADSRAVLRPPSSGTQVVAGKRAIIPLTAGTELRVSDVTGDEMKAALAWKVPRLQFFETPLAVAVAEFNQRNRVRLVLGQRDLDAVPIGGTFGIDNVEGFVRLLEITLALRAERRGDNEIVLTRGR